MFHQPNVCLKPKRFGINQIFKSLNEKVVYSGVSYKNIHGHFVVIVFYNFIISSLKYTIQFSSNSPYAFLLTRKKSSLLKQQPC